MTVKFTFTLKCGKEVVGYCEFDNEEVGDKFIISMYNSFKSDGNFACRIGQLIVRVSDCSAVEWEVFNESEQG